MKKILALLLAFTMILSIGSALAEVTFADALGVIDGDVYRNEYLGVGFILPEGGQWAFLTEEEILLTNQIGKAVLSGDLKEIMETSQNVTLMGAAAPDGLPDIGIQILDLGEMSSLVKMLGFEMILSMQLDDMKSTLESSGMTDVKVELGAIVIDGREVTAMWTQYKFLGIMCYTVAIVLSGNYAVYITAAAVEEGVPEKVLENVFWID